MTSSWPVCKQGEWFFYWVLMHPVWQHKEICLSFRLNTTNAAASVNVLSLFVDAQWDIQPWYHLCLLLFPSTFSSSLKVHKCVYRMSAALLMLQVLLTHTCVHSCEDGCAMKEHNRSDIDLSSEWRVLAEDRRAHTETAVERNLYPLIWFLHFSLSPLDTLFVCRPPLFCVTLSLSQFDHPDLA